MTREDLRAGVLEYVYARPRTFFMIEKTFRAHASLLCRPGRFGPKDIRPELLLHRILQELRKERHIHYVDHAWRFVK